MIKNYAAIEFKVLMDVASVIHNCMMVFVIIMKIAVYMYLVISVLRNINMMMLVTMERV